jgi:glycyl-tRNA synthetase (EC 6.1.1.14)
VRVREFSQAELEQFIDPETDEPPLERVADVSLPLYSARQQEADDGEVQPLTVQEAVDRGVIESDWIAFYWGWRGAGTSQSASTWTGSGIASICPANSPTTPRTAGTPRPRSAATGSR